uniref:Uncharacterized protein n=1 Tax=Monopterus albus TaxID=43700 RepID=A0A3Q3QDS5_MONAL
GSQGKHGNPGDPSNKKGEQGDPGPQGLDTLLGSGPDCSWATPVFSWRLLLSLKVLGSGPTRDLSSKDMQIRLISVSKLPIGVRPCDGLATCPGCTPPSPDCRLRLAPILNMPKKVFIQIWFIFFCIHPPCFPGPRGLPGVDAPPGEKGIPGSLGSPGVTGWKGLKGNQGQFGYRGPNGVSGKKGMDKIWNLFMNGDMGEFGPGSGINNVWGKELLRWLVSYPLTWRGPGLCPESQPATRGDGLVVALLLGAVVCLYVQSPMCTGQTGKTFTTQGVMGVPGTIGVKGERGPAGPKGNTGPPGVRGFPGNQGPPPVPIRYPGERGPSGPMGIQGPKGIIGEPGPRGPHGDADPKVKCFIGPAGQKGMPGISGTPGIPGLRGDVGQMGHPGLQGMEGMFDAVRQFRIRLKRPGLKDLKSSVILRGTGKGPQPGSW